MWERPGGWSTETGARRPTLPPRPLAAGVAGLAGGSGVLMPRPLGGPSSSGGGGLLNPSGLRKPQRAPASRVLADTQVGWWSDPPCSWHEALRHGRPSGLVLLTSGLVLLTSGLVLLTSGVRRVLVGCLAVLTRASFGGPSIQTLRPFPTRAIYLFVMEFIRCRCEPLIGRVICGCFLSPCGPPPPFPMPPVGAEGSPLPESASSVSSPGVLLVS